MYKLFKVHKFDKNKINLKLTVGLTKAVPKLNLTLAPLNINTNNLLLEFNQYKHFLLEDKFIIYSTLYITNVLNFIILKKFDYSQIITSIRNLNFYENNKINTIIFYLILNSLLFFNYNLLNFQINIKNNKQKDIILIINNFLFLNEKLFIIKIKNYLQNKKSNF